MEKSPTPKNEPPKEERQFNPVAEIQRLREMRKASPEMRQEARENIIESLIEQRIKIGWLVRDLEHAVLTDVHNAAGDNLEAARREAEKLLRPPAEMTQLAAERLFEEGLEERNLTLEELVSAGPKERLDGRRLKQIVENGAKEARLPDQAQKAFEAAVAKITETRRAVNFLHEEAGDDRTLFRVLFGREPNGEISFIEGPYSLHVRCFDMQDYALIYSGIYADVEAKVGTEATAEQRQAAKKTGGVALWATRSDREFLEREPLALAEGGAIDPIKFQMLSGALISLRGALTAENASSGEATDADAWRIFRHEERHVRNRLIGEPWTEDNIGRLRELATKIWAVESDIEKHLMELRDMKDDDPRLAAGDARGKMMNERLDSLVTAAESVIARHAEQTVEDMAKDEILAYYADNELEEAVGHTESEDRDKPKPSRPYLRRSRGEGGLYDFHGGNLGDEATRRTVETIGKTAYEEGLTLSGLSEDELAALPAKLGSRSLLDANIRKIVERAIARHKNNYDGLLDRSVEAIALLERRGYSSREVSDILTVEPLRNWLAMAERITGERERRLKNKDKDKEVKR